MHATICSARNQFSLYICIYIENRDFYTVLCLLLHYTAKTFHLQVNVCVRNKSVLISSSILYSVLFIVQWIVTNVSRFKILSYFFVSSSFASYTTAMSSTSGEVKGQVISEFLKIDTLLEGTDDDKQEAKRLLEEMYKAVSITVAISKVVKPYDEASAFGF